jgi:TonB family protein
MIPRTLVPLDVRPPAQAPETPPRRLTTMLDERTLVAANLPHIELDVRTSIPAHLPLEALASRVVVPRDTPATPLDPASLHPDYAPATPLDQRITVPVALPVVELQPKPPVAIQDLPAVLDPDVMTTGEVNLMVEPVEDRRAPDWNWISRAASMAVHMAFVLFLLLLPKLFPYHPPSQEQIDMARRRLTFIYMPPDVRGLPPTPPAPRSPQLRIDPRVLRRIAPSPQFQPIPEPEIPKRAVPKTPTEPPPNLPAAPTPQIQTAQKAPDFLRGPLQAKPQNQPSSQPPNQKLILPRMSSPGRTLEESAQQAIQGGGGTEQFGGPIPGGAANRQGQAGGGGGASGYAGAGIQMLTPTQGVDFSNYLARVLASVKRNWYAVMPESARLGDQGRVVLQFRILRNGGVPVAEPQLMSSSGKEPLDRAAISSIRISSPFEPLPPAFSGPYIELRFIFLYNLPLDYGQ